MKNYEIKNHTIEVDFSNYRINKRLLDYFIYNENDVKTAYIEAILKNKDEIIDLSEYDRVLVSITKSDGQKVNGECEVVDAENGIVEIELSRQALASVGINTFQLSLVKDGTLLNTTNLYYRVEEGMINDDDITSTDEYGVLLVIIAQAEEIIKNNKELTKRVEQLEITILGNEEVRDKAEQIRIYNEDIRNIQEEEREFNELTRQNQEANREESIQNMQIQVDDKLTDCQLQLDEMIDAKSKEIDNIVDDKMLDVQVQTDNKFQDLDTRANNTFDLYDKTFEDKLTDNQEQIDYKLDEVNQAISNVEDCIDESTTKLDTKIKEVDDKIVEVNTAKTDMTTTVSNKITEFENRFEELESLDARGELIQARESVDGTVKDTLKDRLTYDFEKVNEKIAEMTSAATNVAFSKSYVESDWVADGEYFKLIVNHNLVTENIFVAILDEATKKSMTNSYTTVDSNTIEIFNESNIDVKVTVVNGNTNKEVIQATINDNITTLDSTYSSIKIDAKFDESLTKINENKSNIATNLEKINLIQSKVGSSELSTVSKNISDAVNELDASVKVLESGGNTNEQLKILKENYNKMSVEILKILFELELDKEATADEAGYWYDTLYDSKNISNLDGLKLNKFKQQLELLSNSGTVLFKNVTVPFLCNKIRYIHDLGSNYSETKTEESYQKGDTEIKINKYSYEVR
ncbi:TPA: phage tail protein [Clostridioides difficile]|uniref:Phage tail protein n=1 Tax=Clostridioides difficile ATCC 9689 = DSM 1296 TaxID=1121308 RepID=A0ACA7UNE9_CLODI|nr:BppU family phage baseplate upper protein [Clostridioides difficile]YP_009221628.1 tail fiber protein [Clostridium phage phiCD211]AKP44706.1 putative phage tail protein [Peptoclostridium phage phiCDIF1296T]ARC17031.1 phage tail protein [Clostridioides difficile]AVI14494.1 phage tail protein [Clostridioides difficile]EGT3678919.1 phage tail protein [Clostridioides difficile]EGT3825807.1 phage tail protein [Clostridioides difficile]